MSSTRGECRHCQQSRSCPARGLCHHCYQTPAVRASYPQRRAQRVWTAGESGAVRELLRLGWTYAEIVVYLGDRTWLQVRTHARHHGMRSRWWANRRAPRNGGLGREG